MQPICAKCKHVKKETDDYITDWTNWLCKASTNEYIYHPVNGEKVPTSNIYLYKLCKYMNEDGKCQKFEPTLFVKIINFIKYIFKGKDEDVSLQN